MPAACTPGWVTLDPDEVVDIAVTPTDVVWATSERGAIKRASRADGSVHVIHDGGSEVDGALINAMVIAGDRVYWTGDDGAVWSAQVRGDGTRALEAKGLAAPTKMIVVDDGLVIGTDTALVHLVRGAAPVELFAQHVFVMARDGDDIYLEAPRAIHRVPWKGGASTKVTDVPWIGPADSMIAGEELLAWTDSNRGIQAIPKAGGDIVTALDWRTSWTPTQLAVHDGSIFFTMEDTLYRTTKDGAGGAAVAIAPASITSYTVAGDTVYAGIAYAGVHRFCLDPGAAPIETVEPVIEPLVCPAGREYSHTGYEDGCFDKSRSALVPWRTWFHSGPLSGEAGEDMVFHARYHDGSKHYEIPLRDGGATRRWYPDGTLAVDGAWDADRRKHGTWTYYTPAGKVSRVDVWEHGKRVSSR